MPPPGTRILYIDDDPGIRRLVQRHFQRRGCAIQLAESGEEGLRRAAAETFDAIALDYFMPGQDGLAVLSSLCAMPDPPPVILVTGAEEPRIAVTALKSGAADYVTKDVAGDFIELLAASIAHEMQRAVLRRERDAAEREVRESRDRLQALAAQQALLLREVNHRVANSLQLITSLIELQARKVSDPLARGMLRQAAERVEAVTLVHRRLYTGTDVSTVDLADYLAGLVEEMQRMTTICGPEVVGGCHITLSAEPVSVETDMAVPIGLMVNELVTNAAKYAYPEHGGEVRVMLRRVDDEASGALELIVEDDGVGYPAADAAPKGSGLGSLIIGSMAQSLRADVRLDREHAGTRFVIRLRQSAAASDDMVEA